MSFYTGTQAELLYSYANASTNLATFTTEDNLMKTYPPVIIPAGFFFNPSSTGKAIKVKASGQLGSTSAPTFLWTVRLLTSTTWSAAGLVLGATKALTAATTVTLASWDLELDVVLRTLSIGGASTVVSTGKVTGFQSLASPFGGSIPDNNVSSALATVDNSTTYYLFISATCGTSNAANLINMQSLKVYGEN